MKDEDKQKIEIILKTVKENRNVQKMKEYVQHGRVSTYEHSERVAEMSYMINHFLHLHADEERLLRGAMLHDFFLYDWHKGSGEPGMHGFTHAERARKNAKKHFNIDKKEEEIIGSHMWPLNITRVPNCREAWIVCLADKLVSLRETLFERGGKK